MIIEKIDKNYPKLHKVAELYKKSFPKNERDSIKHLLNLHKNGGDFVAFTEGEELCGFASFLTFNKITHILYFAIDPSIRNLGYGTKALKLICDYVGQDKVFVDVERDEDSANNNEERLSRINFYLRNGFNRTNIYYSWKGMDFAILCNNQISIEEYDEFWHHFEFEEDIGEFLYNTFKRK